MAKAVETINVGACNFMMVRWLPPPADWVKANCDGAVKIRRAFNCDGAVENKRAAFAGGLIRDSTGNFLIGFSHNIGDCSVLEAELHGILDVLSMAWHNGYRRVIVEVDSKQAVGLINGYSILLLNGYSVLLLNGYSVEEVPNSVFQLLLDIKDILNREWCVIIQHIYRQGNSAADWLANFGTLCPPGVLQLSWAPEAMEQLLFDDSMGCAKIRTVSFTD